MLFGLTAPFAAALMERFGVRIVVSGALLLVALGSGSTVFLSAPWQLVLAWGVVIGTGTGSMALALRRDRGGALVRRASGSGLRPSSPPPAPPASWFSCH